MQKLPIFCVFLIILISFVDASDKYIGYGKDGTLKARLCDQNAAFDCLVTKHFDTECMTLLNILHGVDAKIMNLDSEDSYRRPFAACVHKKIVQLTKDPEISHDIYITMEEIESIETGKKFDEIYTNLSNSSNFVDIFKFCRLEKIMQCFRQEKECILKSFHETLLNIFDQCKNEKTLESNAKINDLYSFKIPQLFPDTTEEKTQLLNVIGRYPMAAIGNIKRYAELDNDFKNYLCPK